MRIASFDHLVLTVADIEATVAFYERLGMRREVFEGGRTALVFGPQKLNLHREGAEVAPHALRPTRGSADVCLLIEGVLEDAERELRDAGIAIELGPGAANRGAEPDQVALRARPGRQPRRALGAALASVADGVLALRVAWRVRSAGSPAGEESQRGLGW